MDGDEMNDDSEETPEDDAELSRQAAEQFLSECEANSPRVYVLEMMTVQPKKHGRQVQFTKAITSHYSFSMLAIRALVDIASDKTWGTSTTVENGIASMEVAVVADRGILENLGLGGESIWLRAIESDELFEAEDKTLLLQPRQVREIASDFVYDALQTRLSENSNDARLAVLHAAGELLLEHLEEDISLIPHRFSEVVQVIDEVLSEVEWFELTRDSVLRLSDDVICRVIDA